MPPSATASNTTPAWSSPDCGRASSLFSIITPVTGRLLTLGSTGNPVKVDGTVVDTGLTGKIFTLTCLTGAGLECLGSKKVVSPAASTTTMAAIIIHCFLVGGQCQDRRFLAFGLSGSAAYSFSA